MKLKILLSLILVIRLSSGFISYPFTADKLLNGFLNSIEIDETINLDDMISGKLCKRECHHNDTKICHFFFALKYFEIMGG